MDLGSSVSFTHDNLRKDDSETNANILFYYIIFCLFLKYTDCYTPERINKKINNLKFRMFRKRLCLILFSFQLSNYAFGVVRSNRVIKLNASKSNIVEFCYVLNCESLGTQLITVNFIKPPVLCYLWTLKIFYIFRNCQRFFI